MPYTMFLQIQVNVSVTLKDTLGPYIRVREQLVANLHVLQCRRQLEYVQYVPASQHTAGRGCETQTKWLPKLGSCLCDAIGNDVKLSLVLWSD